MDKTQQTYIAIGAILLLIGVTGSYFLFQKNKGGASTSDLYTYNYEEEQPEFHAEPLPDSDEDSDSAILGESNSDTSVNNSESESMDTKLTVQQKLNLRAPDMAIDPKKNYEAIIKTSLGDIKIKLNAAMTPKTVNNFVYLAKQKFYDDVIFHRVIKGFMVQSGDPLGNGMGGPAYKFDDESFEGPYKRGTIAMANSGPNTNGSQFFIMHQDYPLPENYVIFGEAIEGLDILDKIAEQEVTLSDSGEVSKPVNAPIIKSIEISER